MAERRFMQWSGELMLRGNIDTLTTSGFVEGWAFDSDGVIPALEVELRDEEGQGVAQGFAHLFRGDLADVEYGLGWCAFRMRLSASVSKLRAQRLSLWAVRQQHMLHEIESCGLREDFEDAYTDVTQAVAQDCMVLRQIAELRGCHSLFAKFVKTHGVSTFVRAAYGYVLGRAADPDGLAAYGQLLRRGAITPFGLLSELANSPEFVKRSRLLDPPSAAGFVFRC